MGLGELLNCLCPSLGVHSRDRDRRLQVDVATTADGRNYYGHLERVNIELFNRQLKEPDAELVTYLALAHEDGDPTVCGTDRTSPGDFFTVVFASDSLLGYLGCSSRQDYLTRLGAWLTADSQLADQFSRLISCAKRHCPGMVVYPLEDSVQLQDGVYNLTLTIKTVTVVDSGDFLSRENTGWSQPALAVTHKISRLDDLSAMRQQEIALATIPAVVTAVLLDGRVVYQNPRSQHYMGNLVRSFTPRPGTSLKALSNSSHPLKKLFRFEPEALQAFEAAIESNTEFRRVMKVPSRIKEDRMPVSPCRSSRSQAASMAAGTGDAARERFGGSRLIRGVSCISAVGTGIDQGSMAGSRVGREDDGGGGDGSPYGARNTHSGFARSPKSGLVSRETSMSRMSSFKIRSRLMSTSQKAGLLNGVPSAAASRCNSGLVGMAAVQSRAGAAGVSGPGVAKAGIALGSGGARRAVRRCKSVVSLGDLPRVSSLSPSPSAHNVAMTGGRAAKSQRAYVQGRNHVSTGGLSAAAAVVKTEAAVVVERVDIDLSMEGPGAAVQGGSKPGKAVTWTAGLPQLQALHQAGGGCSGSSPSDEQTSLTETTPDQLSGLPAGLTLSDLQPQISVSHGHSDDSSSSRPSETQSVTAGSRRTRSCRVLAAVATAPDSPAAQAPSTTWALLSTVSPTALHSLKSSELHAHVTTPATNAEPSNGAATDSPPPPVYTPTSCASCKDRRSTGGVGCSSSNTLKRTRSMVQLILGSESTQRQQTVTHCARSLGQSRGFLGGDRIHRLLSGNRGKLGRSAVHEDISVESVSPPSSRQSTRTGHRGSFIVLRGSSCGAPMQQLSTDSGMMAASACADFHRFASVEPFGGLVLPEGCGSSSTHNSNGNGNGILNISSGGSSWVASPRSSPGPRPGGRHMLTSPSMDPTLQPNVNSNVIAPGGVRSLLPVATVAADLFETAPVFSDADVSAVQGGAHCLLHTAMCSPQGQDTPTAGDRISGGETYGSISFGSSSLPQRVLAGFRGVLGGAMTAPRERLSLGYPPHPTATTVAADAPLAFPVSSTAGAVSYRTGNNQLSSIREEAGEHRPSLEEYAVAVGQQMARAVAADVGLAPGASWSVGSVVRHPQDSGGAKCVEGGNVFFSGNPLLECGETEAYAEQQVEMSACAPSLVMSQQTSSGSGMERIISSQVLVPSLVMGIAPGMIDGDDVPYTSGGGGGSLLGIGSASGGFRGFQAALRGLNLAEGPQVPTTLLVDVRPAMDNRLDTPQLLAGCRGTEGGGATTTTTTAIDDPSTTSVSLFPMASAYSVVLTDRSQLESPQLPPPPPLQLQSVKVANADPRSHPSLTDAAVWRLLSTAGGGGGGESSLSSPAASHLHDTFRPQSPTGPMRHIASHSSIPLGSPASRDTASSLQELSATVPMTQRSGRTLTSYLSGGGQDTDIRRAAAHDTELRSGGGGGRVRSSSNLAVPYRGGGGGGSGGGSGSTKPHKVALVSDLGVSSGNFTIPTIADGEQYLVNRSPIARKMLLAEAAAGGRDTCGGDIPSLYRTWAAGDNATSGATGDCEASMSRSFTQGMASGGATSARTREPSCSPLSADGKVAAVTAVATATDSDIMTQTSHGTVMPRMTPPPVRRRNTKDHLMTLLTSLSRNNYDTEEASDVHQWHDVHASLRQEPSTGLMVAVITQTVVTDEVEVQRKLEALLEHEHKVLESIFPRHVIEHMTLQAKHPGGAGSGSGVGSAVVGSSWANFRGSAMEALATSHSCVTILFCDIIGFTEMCKEVPAMSVMRFLNTLYMKFDELVDIYGVYKVETIGDCYMVAGGLVRTDVEGNKSVIGEGSEDALHAVRVMSFAMAIIREASEVIFPTSGEPVKLRVGMHSGPVMSGIVGDKMPRFCLFGDTVNTASRMESTCPPGAIHVSADTQALLHNEAWVATGGVQVKGKGLLETYIWAGHEADDDEDTERRLKVYL